VNHDRDAHIFDSLNDAQREAVTAPPGPLLVLAGAGSGKTRVLTRRIAWLVRRCDESPLAVLAVTFTNKASREMRGRIERLLGFSVSGMWMGTFHGLSHRLLRRHFEEAGLREGFEIVDSDDQLRLIRRVLRDLHLDEKQWPPRQAQWFINGHKEEGRRPADLQRVDRPLEEQLRRIYREYESACRRLNVVDFAELMLRSHELLAQNETLRGQYRERFRHVLVDEFQDTNAIQYSWLKLFADGHKNLFAVGDDDQSIYGWRGARVENILRFQQDFPGTCVIRLEQNYRSTEVILNAANAVIACNKKRLGKNLWTEGEAGGPIRVYAAHNDNDEARFVLGRIQKWVEQGNPRSACAVLYRSNAQSRAFEEVLVDAGMPYRVYGGLRFFERAEIKDALAYLRLVSSRDSDSAFERVANMPPRGIGGRTMEEVRAAAKAQNCSLWSASADLAQNQQLAPRAAHALHRFHQLIETISRDTAGLPLEEVVETTIQMSGLTAHHKNDKSERAEVRLENLAELPSAARNFTHDGDAETEPLAAFLSHATLEAGEAQAGEWEDCVQLMSLHSAKGLEFPLVFLTGMEDGLFPHQRNTEDPMLLEEERRLCYVGMTRAMRALYMTHAEVRRLHGREHYTMPSRFLAEVPEQFTEQVRATAAAARTSPPPSPPKWTARHNWHSTAMRPGARVVHKKFGEGTVLQTEGGDKVQVHFKGGIRWLMVALAKMEVVK